jgi:uncharacterized protein
MSATRLLVLQATPFCNINCTYCYLPNRGSRRRMSEDVIRSVGTKILRSGRTAEMLSVLWHAGEPLVLPPSFYRNAFNILSELCPSQIKLVHCIQSNAILLTEEWCDFIQEFQIQLGISVDGPQLLHDAHRVFRNGSGSFSKTMKAIGLLNRRQIPFHVICVLSRDSLQQPEVLFNFFEEHQIHRVHFNIEEIEGVNRHTSLLFDQSEMQFRRFFEVYWDLIDKRNSNQHVREIHDTIGFLITQDRPGPFPSELTTPFVCITISAEGRISTFSPELTSSTHTRSGSFFFGNILFDDLTDIEKSMRFQSVLNEINVGINNCKNSCDYFPVCGGGSPSNKLSENGDLKSTQTLYCKLKVQTLTDLALSRLSANIVATS